MSIIDDCRLYTRHGVEHTVGNTRFLKDTREAKDGYRCHLRRLGHERAADGERRRELEDQ
jgi:hypothetical protein